MGVVARIVLLLRALDILRSVVGRELLVQSLRRIGRRFVQVWYFEEILWRADRVFWHGKKAVYLVV